MGIYGILGYRQVYMGYVCMVYMHRYTWIYTSATCSNELMGLYLRSYVVFTCLYCVHR